MTLLAHRSDDGRDQTYVQEYLCSFGSESDIEPQDELSLVARWQQMQRQHQDLLVFESMLLANSPPLP